MPELKEWKIGVEIIVAETIDFVYDVSWSKMLGNIYTNVSPIFTSWSERRGLKIGI